jgi:hypothetical protein
MKILFCVTIIIGLGIQSSIAILFTSFGAGSLKKIEADIKIGAGGDDNLGIYLLWPNVGIYLLWPNTQNIF